MLRIIIILAVKYVIYLSHKSSIVFCFNSYKIIYSNFLYEKAPDLFVKVSLQDAVNFFDIIIILLLLFKINKDLRYHIIS